MPTRLRYHVVEVGHHESGLLAGLEELHRGLFEGADVVPGQFMRFVTGRLGDETMLLILAMAGDTPVGYGLAFDVAEHAFMPEWRRSGYVTQLYVAPEHRRRGVGKMLVNRIARWLASRGVSRVLLNVSPENEAGNHFWREQGFAPVQIRMRREIEA